MSTNTQNTWDDKRLDPEEVPEFMDTGGEYDEILATINGRTLADQLPRIRMCGPTGCGKTLTSKNIAIDLAYALAIGDEILTELDVMTLSKEEWLSLLDMVEDERVDEDDIRSLDREALEDEVKERMSDEDIEDAPSLGRIYRSFYEGITGEKVDSLPFFDVTLSHCTNAADLLGHPDISSDGSTQYIEGTVTRAIRASNDGPVVLLLDEVNRAPTAAKDELYDAIDDRTKVTLEGPRGGEVVKGTPENLIVVSTMNKGQGHHVEPIDIAEKRRLGPMWEVHYLGHNPDGENNAKPEIDLVVDRTPASRTVARNLVQTANEIRDMAEQGNTDVRYGVPTSSVLDWAKTAHSYYKAGIPNSLEKAGESVVARAIFDHNEQEQTTVMQTISSNIGDMEFDASDEEWSEDATILSCIDCDWSAPKDEAPDEATEFLECPECDGFINTG